MSLNRISGFRDKLGVVTRAFFAQRSVVIIPDSLSEALTLIEHGFCRSTETFPAQNCCHSFIVVSKLACGTRGTSLACISVSQSIPP